jgi:hypothetical protein
VNQFNIGDRVKIVDKRPSGYTAKQWELYAGLHGVVDQRSPGIKVAFPVLVLIDDGRRIWFSDKELTAEQM